MADQKISALPATAGLGLGTTIVVVNAGVSERATLAQLATGLQLGGMPFVTSLSGDHAISSATATEVALTATGLAVGTYLFEYFLIVQSATSTVSPLYGVNFTGTATMNAWMDYADASATLLAMLNTADAVGTTALGFAGRQAVTAFATTTCNMGHVGGVDPINANIMVKITGILLVTVIGDLDFWHASETASSTTIKAGSSLRVTRTA